MRDKQTKSSAGRRSTESASRPRVSVVIPTLAGAQVGKTLQALWEGTLLPSEVLLCVPQAFTGKAEQFSGERIRVVSCPEMGQVRQRAYGFQFVKSNYVLQLDDDIQLDHNCLAQLVMALEELGPRAAVAPRFFLRESGQYAYQLPDQTWRSRFWIWLANGSSGFQSGAISSSGINLAPIDAADSILPVGWIPGGCALHRRANLITENYYPFSGKAYAEDVYHSQALAERGVSLFVCGPARVWFSWGDIGPRNQWRSLLGEFRAFRSFALGTRRPIWRIYAIFAVRCLSLANRLLLYPFRKLWRLIRNTIHFP